ncbi:MAG: hypothetical protein PWQ06_2714 [Anaerophaga sp.]|nr:hypothetical protein [Anaerophaga sp.]
MKGADDCSLFFFAESVKKLLKLLKLVFKQTFYFHVVKKVTKVTGVILQTNHFLFDENTSLFAKCFTNVLQSKSTYKKIRCKCLIISVTPTGFKPVTF